MSQLPKREIRDSSEKIRTFFNKFYEPSVNLNAGDVDSVIAYFLKRGFEEIAAVNTANVLLQQAAKDKVNVQKLIDTLDGASDVQLSNIVAEILNINRDKISQLGYKTPDSGNKIESRNIVV